MKGKKISKKSKTASKKTIKTVEPKDLAKVWGGAKFVTTNSANGNHNLRAKRAK